MTRWSPGIPADPVPDESLGAAMLYSSGTTGQPKGVLRDLPTAGPDEPLPVMEFVRAMFGFREGMTYLNPAPLYHSAPQASVAAALRLGCTAVVMEHFDPEQWLALVERYRVTHCQMVPVMFSRLLRLPDDVRARYDTSSLECIVHAAAPCPVHVKQAMIDWLGPIITEYYGATEANGFTFCTSAEWLAHPGTVGRPILGELLILDAAGNECPTGSGRDRLVPRRDRLRVLQRSGEDRREPLQRRHGQRRRGRRPRRRGRVPVPDRQEELHDHLRRGQHLPAGNREHPVRSPGRPGRGGHRRPERRPRRGGQGGGTAR